MKKNSGIKIEEYFNDFYEELIPKYKKVIKAITHKTSKGTTLEKIVKDDILRKYVPERYGIDPGFITTLEKPGWISPQIDLIIWDKLNYFPIVDLSDYKLFPIEAIIGIVEIASYVDDKKLEKDFKKAMEIKKLTKRKWIQYVRRGDTCIVDHKPVTIEHFQPRFYYFGFQSKWKKQETVAKKVLEHYKKNPDLNPNAIYIMKSGLYKSKPKEKKGEPPIIYCLADPIKGFVEFLNIINNELALFPTCPMDHKIVYAFKEYVYK